VQWAVSDDLDSAVSGCGLRPAYQPIVTLPDQQVVGYEALARWPARSDLTPAAVFARAEQTGAVGVLDNLCVARAAAEAMSGPTTPGMLLFINSEPESPYLTADAKSALTQAGSRFTVVFELTERGLLTHPHALLRKVLMLRRDGFLIALDDVGAHPESLALLDVIAPDIIKLDLRLVQDQPDRKQARTLTAVLAYHERTGAPIVAEGIETAEHLEQALAYGATLGQGFLFGRAGELAPIHAPWTLPSTRTRSDPPHNRSIFDLVTTGLPVRTVRKQTLIAFSRQIERLAAAADSPPIVLTTLEHSRYFTPGTRRRYQQLAETSPLIAIFGHGLPVDLGRRIRGVDLDPSDPLCIEWTILVLGPDTATGLIAREYEDDTCSGASVVDADRRFEMTMTFDRSRVALAARNLLHRIG
jgi:EAL domain-containing protein (putative c-di-GMP-specific phosphodiesterase class I)